MSANTMWQDRPSGNNLVSHLASTGSTNKAVRMFALAIAAETEMACALTVVAKSAGPAWDSCVEGNAKYKNEERGTRNEVEGRGTK